MDRESIVKSVMKTGRLLTVEEGWYQSGIGAEVIASVSESMFALISASVYSQGFSRLLQVFLVCCTTS